MRRIITGHNQAGKSVITIDSPPARSIGEDVGGLFEIWNTDGLPVDTKDNLADALTKPISEEDMNKQISMTNAMVLKNRHPLAPETKQKQ